MNKQEWIQQRSRLGALDLPMLNPLNQVNDAFRKGLSSCKWPARNQIIDTDNVTYYIDGAHTIESINQFIDWFKASQKENRKNVLLFNVSGEREPAKFIRCLMVNRNLNQKKIDLINYFDSSV